MPTIRRTTGFVATAAALCVAMAASAPRLCAQGDDGDFIRGDVNLDGQVGHVDALALLDALFLLGDVSCGDPADVNDDGVIDIGDAVRLLAWSLGQDQPPPAPPFPEPGPDPTADELRCDSFEVVPPAVLDAYAFGWETPGVVEPGAAVETRLLVSTGDPIDCFSIAYRVDTSAVADLSVDFEGTLVPPDIAAELAAAGFVAVSYDPAAGADFGLLRVRVIFRTAEFGGIDFEATQRPLGAEPLLRVVLSLREGIPDGDAVELLSPALPDDIDRGEPGGLNEFCRAFDAVLPRRVESIRVDVRAPEPPVFIRGDANLSGQVTQVDALEIINFLFFDLGDFPCREAADVNDDGEVTIADGIVILSYLFADGPAPVEPFPLPGVDPTPGLGLGCEKSTVEPPVIDFTYVIDWEHDPELLQGTKTVDLFLLATTSAPTECFSIAYRIDRGLAENIRGDFGRTLFPEERREEFESSLFFDIRIVPLDADHDLLQVGALFTSEADFSPIPFAATERPLVAERLFHLVIDIPFDAPVGEDLVLLEPVPPEQLPPGNGLFNEFCQSGEAPAPGAGGGGGVGGGGAGGGARGVQPQANQVVIKIVGGEEFLRGDSNNDGTIDISDVVFTPIWLFGGTQRKPGCMEAADANGDAEVNVSDASFLANWLFSGGPAPPYPHSPADVCEYSPITSLGCDDANCDR